MTTDNRTNELIAEAREWASSYVSWGDNGIVDRLADALEAATRVPVQGEPNDDREAILKKALEHVREVGESGLAGAYVHDLPKDVDSNWGWLQTMWPVAIAVDIALASRAAVPDVVTEAHREALGYVAKTIDNCEDLPDDLKWDNSEVVEMLRDILAALDGAPEPEDEEEEYQAGCGSWDCRAPECGRA